MNVCNDKMRKFINSSSATVGAYLHCWELELTGKFEKSAVITLRERLRDWKDENPNHKAALGKILMKYFRQNQAYFYITQDCPSWKEGIKLFRLSDAPATSQMIPLNFELMQKMFARNDLWPNEAARDKMHLNFHNQFGKELAAAKDGLNGEPDKMPESLKKHVGDIFHVSEDAVISDTGRSVSKSRAFAEHYGNNLPISKGYTLDDEAYAKDIFGVDLNKLEERIYQTTYPQLADDPYISKETEMSNNRKLVRLSIIDNDAGLKVEHSMVHTSDAFVSEDDNQTTIMQYLSEQPMNEILLKHNNVRESQVDEVILRNTGNTVMLRPVKLKDLTIEVRPV